MNTQPAQPQATDPIDTKPAHLRRIVLTGFMGAGKSTVGRLLAARVGWDFLDLDSVIESLTGLTIPVIFATHGESHFRQLESDALASALGRDNLVLALGGGAPETLTNRVLLERTPATATIFLDAPFAVLYDRCLLQALNPAAPSASAPPSSVDIASEPAKLQDLTRSRPNLADPAAAEARFLIRQPLYRRLAHHTIDTSTLTTEETVATLIEQLQHVQPHLRR
jgi:shikimate kinase